GTAELTLVRDFVAAWDTKVSGSSHRRRPCWERRSTRSANVIEAQRLSKRYGPTLAVDDLSFVVRPGVVTGFLGPNGAGKSTTMRLLLGLDRPSGGACRINGKAYVDFPAPLREVGALLEARAVHTGRSARNHLMAMAATNGIKKSRVEEMLGLVGLDEV